MTLMCLISRVITTSKYKAYELLSTVKAPHAPLPPQLVQLKHLRLHCDLR